MKAEVLVTGASGHIGANLVRQLIERGFRVRALVRHHTEALDGLDIETIQGDITNQESLPAAFRGVDTVYHLAAHISIAEGEWEALEKINVDGTRNVVAACRQAGVSTLVHFSSIHALDMNPPDQPVTESNPPVTKRSASGSDYDVSKARADALVRANSHAGLSTRIIHPTAVFGPNDFQLSLLGQAIVKMATGRLPALVEGGFDWVDARDVASIAIDAAQSGTDGDAFIVSGHYLEMREFADLIAGLTGVPASRFNCPIWLARASAPLMGVWARMRNEAPLYTRNSLRALQENPCISHARATQHLSYQPRPIYQSMSDTLKFYAERDLLRMKNHEP